MQHYASTIANGRLAIYNTRTRRSHLLPRNRHSLRASINAHTYLKFFSRLLRITLV